MRIDSAGVDHQSLGEFHSREVLCFRFSLKGLGYPRKSPSIQLHRLAVRKSNVPGESHLSPQHLLKPTKGWSFRLSENGKNCLALRTASARSWGAARIIETLG